MIKTTLQKAKHRLVAGGPFRRHRRRIAKKYLHGQGLEIGALQEPLEVPAGAEVKYVDRLSVPELRKHYPELDDLALVEVDVIDDGQTLERTRSGSQDFVIANHFIEHTEDPIGTIKNHLRVLKPGGILYLAVPNKRFNFDADREPTGFDHLVRDHEAGPAASRMGHYREWAEYVDKAKSVEAAAERLESDDYSIHFHVWTPESFLDFLTGIQARYRLPFELEVAQTNEQELITILRKTER